MESEGMAVAVTICARTKDLTLGPIVTAYNRYAPSLEPEHPVLELLRERFSEVAQDAEEDFMRRVQVATWPSEARAVMAEVRVHWCAPERPPWGGDPLFPQAEASMQRLRRSAEDRLFALVPHCRTSSGLRALEEAIEREFQEWPTKLRGRLRSAKVTYREYIEQMGQTAFGWPPVGNLSPLCSMGRWLAAELGEDNMVVEDFVAAVKRSRKALLKDAADELALHLAALTQVRSKLLTVPAPPKLLRDGYEEDIDELLAVALPVVNRRREENGMENSEVLRLVRDMLLRPAFNAQLVEECEEVAEVLRRPDPPANPGLTTEEGEERMAAGVKMVQLLAFLKADDAQRAAAIESEFAAKLEQVRPWVGLFDDLPGDKDEEGWHQPPGFATIERPLGQSTPPPTPWRPPPTPPAVPPGPQPDVSVKMRLHGVTIEEARKNSEFLLLEKLAMIVAKECGIPREWINHIALAPPKAKEALQDVPLAEEAMSFADLVA